MRNFGSVLWRRLHLGPTAASVTVGALIGVTAGFGGRPAAAAPQAPRPTALERIISKRVASIISRGNYSHQQLDDEMSRLLFAEYFDRLDRNRAFLSASDVEEFRSYAVILDDLVLQGNIDFAYDVYARFLQRVRERVELIRARLEQPFDFTLHETIVKDRSDQPWFATREQFDEYWRKRLKNEVLAYRLAAAKKPGREEAGEAEPAPGAAADAEQTDAGAGAPDASVAPAETKSPPARVLEHYERYLTRIEQNESIDVLEIFLSSMSGLYDPHSAYMAPDTQEDFDISMKHSLQGIGALLTTEDSYVKVAEIIGGGPAELDGRLKEGDFIVAVAQENGEPVDVIGMPLRKVVRLIRGRKGTTVLLSVWEAAKGKGGVPSVIDIVRDEVKLTSQDAKCEVHSVPAARLAPGEAQASAEELEVAVIALPSFYADLQGRRRGLDDYKSASRDVRRLIEAAARDGADGLILDLRSNGGGALEEAIELAGLFFRGGPVVQVKEPDGRVRKRYDPNGDTVYDGPLLIMVDRLSASASEIVAAAIQDYHRGVIFGEASTHGKGTVQKVLPLDSMLRPYPAFRGRKAGSLKLTVQKFYRVNGGSTQIKGVEPGIVIPSFTDHMELGERHLEHALPWDTIEPLEVTCDVDVRPYIEVLRQRSETRRRDSEEYQLLLADIEKYGERRKETTLSLNLEERLRLQEEEDAWSQKLRSHQSRRRRDGARQDADSAPAADRVLEEALRVMADLIALQNGTPLVSALGTPPAAMSAGAPPLPPVTAGRAAE